MLYLLRAKRELGRNVDACIFRAMLYYLDVFPGRMHHPKEEAILFEALRCRSRAIDSVLDELTREHETLEREVGHLEQALLRYEEGGDVEFNAFATHAARYANEYLEHLYREEDLVLPYALEVLSAEDWDEIDATLTENQDPLQGADTADYKKLFARIVALSPPDTPKLSDTTTRD